MRNILIDKALLSISLAGLGQLVKKLITLEPQGIFGLNAYLFIFTFSIHSLYAKHVTRLVLVAHHFGLGILVNMLRTLELNGIFDQI